MRNIDEVLIIPTTHLSRLLPILIAAGEYPTYVLRSTVIDNSSAYLVDGIVYSPLTLESYRLQMLFVPFGAKFCGSLVITLIYRLQKSALDQNRLFSGFGRYDSCEVVDA